MGIGQPAGLIAGVALLVFGVALAGSGSGQFRRAETNIIPFAKASVLVTDAVFRWSRNPMYLGMLVALLGAAYEQYCARTRRWL